MKIEYNESEEEEFMNNKGITILEPPIIEIATNKFINVPIILQYDDVNLIEVIQVPEKTVVTYQTQIPIYHPDGTYLAKVIGSRLVLTDAGKKAAIKLEHPDKMTVGKLGNTTLFEMRRTDAAAISLNAELYTPKGYMVKCANEAQNFLELMSDTKDQIQLMGNGVSMKGCTFIGCKVGIKISSDGSVRVGSN